VDKLQRFYELVVETNPPEPEQGVLIPFNLPFTLEFEITRSILSDANDARFRLYNLSRATRNRIYKDRNSSLTYRRVQLRAGYGEPFANSSFIPALQPIVFKGNIAHCYSKREGLNIITTIEAYDAGFAFVNSNVNPNYGAGTPNSVIFDDLISKMNPTVTKGVVGNFPGTIKRGNSFSGSAKDILDELTGGAFFVDKEKAYILGENECIEGSLPVINSQSGLLGTPIREDTIISFDMIFEPRLEIGQLVRLETFTEEGFNGDYRVISIKHRGMISDSVAGSAITTVGLMKGFEFIVRSQ